MHDVDVRVVYLGTILISDTNLQCSKPISDILICYIGGDADEDGVRAV